MTEGKPYSVVDPYEFILESMDSVPHLETLMLLWNSRPVRWDSEELASRLYIPAAKVEALLRDLVRMEFVAESQTAPPRFSYLARSEDQNELMNSLDVAYRRDLVRISNMIHSKASPAVREFARAFRVRKDRE